jgi:hypothetical protein
MACNASYARFIFFWKVFHKYYNLICIFICTPICTKLYSCKKWVLQPPSSYPILVHPLGLHHWPHLMEIDRTVPIGLEKRPKLRIMGLLATFIHRGFTIVIDCARLCLLGISDGHVGGPLNRCMPLKHFMVFLIFIARVRGVVM